MKPTLPPYVCLLLFIVTTQLLFSSKTTRTAAASEDVRDSNGNKVLNDVPYYIGAVTKAGGGQITLTDTIDDEKVCPLIVKQDPYEQGQFLFTLVGKRQYLRTDSVLSIDSGIISEGECQGSTFWTIPDAEGAPPSNLITTGGGFDEATTCFQVVKYPKPTSAMVPSYMLQHCPSFCGAGPAQTCFNISIYDDNGVRRLSSSNGRTPFEFSFDKVQSTYGSM